jgi:hypothetical protein
MLHPAVLSIFKIYTLAICVALYDKMNNYAKNHNYGQIIVNSERKYVAQLAGAIMLVVASLNEGIFLLLLQHDLNG